MKMKTLQPIKAIPIQSDASRFITVEEIKRFSTLSAHYQYQFQNTGNRKYNERYKHYQNLLKTGRIATLENE